MGEGWSGYDGSPFVLVRLRSRAPLWRQRQRLKLKHKTSCIIYCNLSSTTLSSLNFRFIAANQNSHHPSFIFHHHHHHHHHNLRTHNTLLVLSSLPCPLRYRHHIISSISLSFSPSVSCSSDLFPHSRPSHRPNSIFGPACGMTACPIWHPASCTAH